MIIKKFILLIYCFYFYISYVINIKNFQNGLEITHMLKRNNDIKNIQKTIKVKSITNINIFCYFPILTNDIYHTLSLKSIFNDPFLKEQWYFLKANSSSFLTHNLENVWERNITGNGTVIGIISCGIEVDHKDLRQNYVGSLSYNFVDESIHQYPTPDFAITDFTGFIAASSNNYECGVGAAPSSLFSSLQIFNEKDIYLKDERLSRALEMEINKIDIYVLLFDLLPVVEIDQYPGSLTVKSLEKGFTFGRQGKGNIYVMSSGNSHDVGSNCAFIGLAQRVEIFVIASILNNGRSTVYSERCVSVLASAISTATEEEEDLLYTTQIGNECGRSVGGITHISASIATGIISLLLSDNPLLSARQVFLSIVFSSTQYDDNSIRNAAGFRYSLSFGFGFLNASEMIRMSKETQILNPGQQNICEVRVYRRTTEIEKNSHRKFYIYSDGCFYTKDCVSKIEQTFLQFSLETYSRNSVTIYMTSPSGTKYKILEPRRYDFSDTGFNEYKIKILGYFGENTIGYWIVDIYSHSYPSFLKSIKIEFYGTCYFEPYIETIFDKNISEVTINHNKNVDNNSNEDTDFVNLNTKYRKVRFFRQFF